METPQYRSMTGWPNKALDPTAVSASVLWFTDFTMSLSFLDRAYPAVGQLDRWANERIKTGGEQ